MLSNIVAELITEKVNAVKLSLNQKFCFSVLASPPKDAQKKGATGHDVLDIEIMPTGSRDDSGLTEYTVKINDLTLPINVNSHGLQALLMATFLQVSVIDFTTHNPWWQVEQRVHNDYENTRTEGAKTGLLYRISG